MNAPLPASAPAALDPADWIRVENFLADYAHRLDDGLIDDWTGFFTEDATYQITTRENFEAGYPIGILLCKGRGMMEDRVLALKTANVFEPHTHCHIVGRPDLRQEAPGVLASRSNFNVFRTMEDGEAELFATGKYLDKIVFEAGMPKFRERRVILDSRRVDVLLVYPL
jgi:3-phenylpropionate/cinnamic acid dioxygenase small subunit